MDGREIEVWDAYDRGYKQGLIQGRIDADVCVGCDFEDVESWQPPCTMCKRNCTDYWRAKVVE